MAERGAGAPSREQGLSARFSDTQLDLAGVVDVAVADVIVAAEVCVEASDDLGF